MSQPLLLFELAQPPPEKGGALDDKDLIDRPDPAPGIFALAVTHIMQVMEAGVVTPVPLAPSVVEGVLNHHGRIVTIVDPAPLLGLAPQPQPANQVVILRRRAGMGGGVGLKVNRTFEIVAASDLVEAEVPPGPGIQQVLRQDPKLVHVISHDALLMELSDCFDLPPARRPDAEAQGVSL